MPRRWAKYALVAVSAVLGLLLAMWALRFPLLALDEGALPPKSRIPHMPADATVLEETEACGSGGCWWLITVKPPAGQSPEELARDMGLSEKRREPATLLDPGAVYVGAEARGDELVIHVGYQ